MPILPPNQTKEQSIIPEEGKSTGSGSPVGGTEPPRKTMRARIQEKSTGSKGFEHIGAQGLARCGGRVGTGVASPSSSGCNRDGGRVEAGAPSPSTSNCNQRGKVNKIGKIGTWNIRSLGIPSKRINDTMESGKIANIIKEMKRMGVGILGVAETCREGVGSFPAQLPESVGGDKYIVFMKTKSFMKE